MNLIPRRSAAVARRTHYPEAVSSNLTAATKFEKPENVFVYAEETLWDDPWPTSAELRATSAWIVIVAAFLALVWGLLKLPE